jgi:hypothetical protein
VYVLARAHEVDCVRRSPEGALCLLSQLVS